MITVDNRSQLERLMAAARRLEVVEPEELERITLLAEGFARLHDPVIEPRALFDGRLAAIYGRTGVS